MAYPNCHIFSLLNCVSLWCYSYGLYLPWPACCYTFVVSTSPAWYHVCIPALHQWLTAGPVPRYRYTTAQVANTRAGMSANINCKYWHEEAFNKLLHSNQASFAYNSLQNKLNSLEVPNQMKAEIMPMVKDCGEGDCRVTLRMVWKLRMVIRMTVRIVLRIVVMFRSGKDVGSMWWVVWMDTKKLKYFMKKIHVKRWGKLHWRGEGTLPEVQNPM